MGEVISCISGRVWLRYDLTSRIVIIDNLVYDMEVEVAIELHDLTLLYITPDPSLIVDLHLSTFRDLTRASSSFIPILDTNTTHYVRSMPRYAERHPS
jgi:hypothetical protein